MKSNAFTTLATLGVAMLALPGVITPADAQMQDDHAFGIQAMLPLKWQETATDDEFGLGDLELRTGIVGRLAPSLRSRLRTPLRYAPFRAAPSAPAAQFRVPRRSILDPQAMLSCPLSHPAAYSLR